MDYLVYGFFGMSVLSLCGLGYFTIWRLTDRTNTQVERARPVFIRFVEVFNEVRDIIFGLDKRLRELETEIKLQKNDSSRLVEWLDKERSQRDAERIEFLKSLKLTERESKIVEISERLRLITKK